MPDYMNSRYKPRRRNYRKRPRVPRETQRIRALNGQRPLTAIEHIAGYGRGLGTVAKTVSQMYGLINSEVKFKDTTLTGVAISNTGGDYSDLNDIAQGDDWNARNGRTILDKNLIYKLRFISDAADTTTNVGWAIIMKKGDAALSATPWTEVFTSTQSTALMNKNFSDSFIVLRRGNIILNNVAINQALEEGVINLKGIHTKYDGTAATNFETGQIFIVYVSDQSASYPSVYGTLRFQYYDN